MPKATASGLHEVAPGTRTSTRAKPTYWSVRMAATWMMVAMRAPTESASCTKVKLLVEMRPASVLEERSSPHIVPAASSEYAAMPAPRAEIHDRFMRPASPSSRTPIRPAR